MYNNNNNNYKKVSPTYDITSGNLKLIELEMFKFLK